MWHLRIVEFAFFAFREIEAHLHWCFTLLSILGVYLCTVWARWLGSFLCGFCCVRCAFLRQTPSCEMCASYSSDGSDEEDSEQSNMWNVVLKLFTLWEISPRLQQGLEDWEMCRVALTCHFALDVFCVVVYSG